METAGLKSASSSISTEDILKTLDRFGGRSKTPSPDPENKINVGKVRDFSESIGTDPLDAGHLHEKYTGDELDSDVTFPILGSGLGLDGGNNVEKDWNALFGLEWFYSKLRQQALEGKLKNFKFRSVCWKVFLECLTENTDEWITKATQLRQEYAQFKEKCLVDPNKANQDVDLTLNNPLSQDENSLWKQYFQDNELKATINQDLDRLWPEMDFFQQSRIKQSMLNILFCHAKKNEALSYKQGMHELLAPIIYVLERDSKLHQYFEGTTLEIAQVVLDPQWLEHDAYGLFSQLMDRTETWFLESRVQRQPQRHKLLDPHAEPFSGDTEPSTAIVKKLNRIQDYMLRKHDPDLWIHMKNLDITPQVYGLRWIRLLFGREFSIDDLLIVWDALFADGPLLDLVDYVYIVMLESIREKLLRGTYSACIGYLMKFPRVYKDVYRYVEEALTMRNLKTSSLALNNAPRSSSAVPSQSAGTFPRAKNPVARRHPSSLSTFTKRYIPSREPARQSEPARTTKQAQESSRLNTTGQGHVVDGKLNELMPRNARSPRPASVPVPDARERADSGSLGSSPVRAMKAFGNKLTKPKTRSRIEQEELQKDHERLQKRVSELNTEVDKIQGMLIYYGRKMDSYIGLLQEEVLKDETTSDQDIIYLSLAGLKQIRDMLKGAESFRGSTTEHDCDFMDIDNSIASRLQILSSNLTTPQEKDLPENIPVPFLGDFGHFQDSDEKESSFIIEQGEDGKAGITTGPLVDGEVDNKLPEKKDVFRDQAEREFESQHVKEGVQRSDENGMNVVPMLGSISSGKVDQLWATSETPSMLHSDLKIGESSAFRKLGSSSRSSAERLVEPNESVSHPLEGTGLEGEITKRAGKSVNDELSDISPSEHAPLQGFVLVNRDGTTEKSPDHPGHPLENSQEDDPLSGGF